MPEGSKIHPVFHVSQLKLAINPQEQVLDLPQVCLGPDQIELEPAEVLDKRYDSRGVLELLVTWVGKSSADNTWLPYQEFVEQFPDYKLEGKLGFVGGGIDRFKKAYFRRKKGKEVRRERERSDVAGAVGSSE